MQTFKNNPYIWNGKICKISYDGRAKETHYRLTHKKDHNIGFHGHSTLEKVVSSALTKLKADELHKTTMDNSSLHPCQAISLLFL